ncbi:ComF family protein [Candidatus Microgenomates bacterium]|nr:ComF family protein [Candidatus Microgenomates bacterium]
MTNWILDILFPKKCVGCGKEGSYFCQNCIRDIKQTDLVCPRCERLAVGGQTHPVCRRKYGLDGLWSLGIYQDSLRSAIQQLKYKGIKDLAEILMDITIEYWAKYQPFVLDQIKKDQGVGWVVIPVPLYWWRANSRGFNQSSLIGQILSKKLGLGYCDGLKRIRYTRSQAKLKGKQRKQNISGAFEISSDYTLSPKPYTLLIDDVWTTGSTLRECCWILKRAGAKKVWAITLAR